MKGSNSSPILLIQNQKQQKFVLRLLDNQEWLEEEPDLAKHEAAALAEARKTGLTVPELIGYSEDLEQVDCPVVLTSFLEGKVELHPANVYGWLQELASQLAVLHQHHATDFAWQYQSWNDNSTLQIPAWTDQPAHWEHAIELIKRTAPNYPAVFIHRDYHPTNVLWKGNGISGIVDWINACKGPAGVDVAHCRNNLALMFGVEAADLFLKMYLQAAGEFEYNAYWDIDSILNMCLPEPEYYKPWQEFGMDMITQQVLQHRTEVYLESVLRLANSPL